MTEIQVGDDTRIGEVPFACVDPRAGRSHRYCEDKGKQSARRARPLIILITLITFQIVDARAERINDNDPSRLLLRAADHQRSGRATHTHSHAHTQPHTGK